MRLDNEEWIKQLKRHLHALKKSAQHSQFSTFKRIGTKCTFGTSDQNFRRDQTTSRRRAVPIFLARVNGG